MKIKRATPTPTPTPVATYPQVSAKLLGEVLSQCLRFVSGEQQSALAGVLLALSDDGITLCATDGVCLLEAKIGQQTGEVLASGVLAADSARTLSKACSGAVKQGEKDKRGEVLTKLAVDSDGELIASVADAPVVKLKLIPGVTFPNYDRLFVEKDPQKLAQYYNAEKMASLLSAIATLLPSESQGISFRSLGEESPAVIEALNPGLGYAVRAVIAPIRPPKDKKLQ